MKKDSFLSIVIPVYNEEGNIELLTKGIEDALTDYKYEIIFIDDYSTDKTRQDVKNMKNPSVVLIEMKKNYGQSSAMMAGIEYAHGDYVVTMDGDMQNDPSDIPMMMDVLQEGDYDVVTGIRQKGKIHFLKLFLQKLPTTSLRRQPNSI